MNTKYRSLARLSIGNRYRLLALGLLACNLMPAHAADFDLSRDYSPAVNPSAPWSYGAKPSLNGSFSLFTIHGTTPADGGVPIQYWQLIPLAEPTLFHNGTTGTATIGGGHGTLPPGTTYLFSGTDGLSNGFGVVRFTAPAAGDYILRASARPLYNTSIQGDTDYHIVRNGVELFGRSLAGQQSASYSNVLALAAGDRLDFMVGRGADNSGFASGLKIEALLTGGTNVPPPPPPPPAADFDLSRDYSPAVNPSAPWSYGAKPSLNGSFSLFTIRGTTPADGGVPIQYWQLIPLAEPTLFHNGTTGTATIGGGQGTLPPGTTYLFSGTDGLSNGFGVVRFTAPAAGDYTVQATARPVYDTSIQGDTDYHIVKNGVELFGRSLAGQQSASYSNVVALAAGDRLDFMVGRGADSSGFASGLKIEALLTGGTNVPPPPPPPPAADFDLSRDYSPAVNPSAPWSYGAKPSLNGSFSLFTIRGTTPADGGVPIQYWQLIPLAEPTLFHNGTTGTATIGGGQGTLPPGTTYLFSGTDGLSNGFGVVRFTAPAAGDYILRASARPLYNTSIQGDTDYHIVKNGVELFGRSLAGQQSASYSNVVALAAGDRLDFMVGRGADSSGFASGLKIEALLTGGTNVPPPPPPPPAADFDLSRDYSPAVNPSAPWSYGAKPSLNGSFSLFTIRGTTPADGGVPIQYWQLIPLAEPTLFHNGTTGTATIGGGQGTLPPGTTYLFSGTDGLSNGFGVVRFTAPAAGDYILRASARPLYNTSIQGDTDYHIVKNGVELFGRSLAGQQSASYSNVVALAAGDRLDFMVGRGADNSGFASGLKIDAAIDLLTSPPPTNCISAALDLLAALIDSVESLEPPVNTTPLLASLQASEASFRRGSLASGIGQAYAFQNQVRAQVQRVDAALAGQLIARAQEIINAANCPAQAVALRATDAPLRIECVATPPTDGFMIAFFGRPGANYYVQVSENLREWRSLGQAIEITDGVYVYFDSEPPGLPSRFYRSVGSALKGSKPSPHLLREDPLLE